MIERNITPLLKKALGRSPVVLLNGARQVGKTTLISSFIKNENRNYITFDDEMAYLAAKSNPTGFLAAIEKPVAIDEVQRVPELFLAIKRDVDANRIPGRYLLTGSANPLLIPRLGDSLAGRMEVIDLMPLSQGELEGKSETFIDTIWKNTPLKSPKKELSQEALYAKMVQGGYPGIQKKNEEDKEAWMRSYINLILQRDIKELAHIEKITELPTILKILAYRASGLLNIAEISRDCKMVSQTVNRYIALLETIFLIQLQPAWSTNLILRFIKAPKVYMVDSGLLAYLLGINRSKTRAEPELMGKILENFVMSELKKQSTWSETQPQAYHLRTSSGQEVDIILENRAGQIIGIEVKNSTRVVPHDFKWLRSLQEKAGNRFVKGIVLYTGSQYMPFGDHLFALPINSLWE
jgi:predicted AAA+ superfamily ATPase